MKKLNQYHSRYGVGGRYCSCCGFGGPRSAQRKKSDRIVKKRIRNEGKKEARMLSLFKAFTIYE